MLAQSRFSSVMFQSLHERFPVEPSHYDFKPLTKSKLGHKFVSTNKSISYSTVREYFKSSFKDIVPDIAVFSTHS